MKDIISLFLLLPLIIYILFQPYYNQLVHMRGVVLELEANRAIKDVSNAGMLTTGIKDKIKLDLQNLHFDPTKLVITTTDMGVPLARGNRIEIEIKYPRGKAFVLSNFWGTDDTTENYYVYRVSEMSEYIP